MSASPSPLVTWAGAQERCVLHGAMNDQIVMSSVEQSIQY